MSTASGESLGIVGTTTDLDGRVLLSLDFVAPPNASDLSILVFSSLAANGGIANCAVAGQRVPRAYGSTRARTSGFIAYW
jgi:hypothetical protein